MTAYSSACQICRKHCDWIDCPTGGWWAHQQDPADGPVLVDHDAQIDWQPVQELDDNGRWVTV